MCMYFTRWLICTNLYDLTCTILYDLSKPQWRAGVGHSYKFIWIGNSLKIYYLAKILYICTSEVVPISHLIKYVRSAVRLGWIGWFGAQETFFNVTWMFLLSLLIHLMNLYIWRFSVKYKYYIFQKVLLTPNFWTVVYVLSGKLTNQLFVLISISAQKPTTYSVSTQNTV